MSGCEVLEGSRREVGRAGPSRAGWEEGLGQRSGGEGPGGGKEEVLEGFDNKEQRQQDTCVRVCVCVHMCTCVGGEGSAIWGQSEARSLIRRGVRVVILHVCNKVWVSDSGREG